MHSNLVGVGDELTTAKDPGAGGDEGDVELEYEMGEVEEVSNGVEDGDATMNEVIDLDTYGAADVEQVEVEGVNEEGDEAGDEEYVVPPEDDITAGVENAVGLPWLVAVEMDGDRGVVEREQQAEGAEEDPGGGTTEGTHCPCRKGAEEEAVAMEGGVMWEINEWEWNGDRCLV